MTFDTEVKERVLTGKHTGDSRFDGWASDAILKRVKTVMYPYQHHRDHQARVKTDEEKREAADLVVDLMPRMHVTTRRCVRISAAFSVGDRTQVTLQVFYDQLMLEFRKCLDKGCKSMYLLSDTGVPHIKASEAKKRDATRKRKRPQDDDGGGGDEDGDNGPDEVTLSQNGEGKESPGYIPSSQYRGANPIATVRFCIRDNQLVKYDHATRRVLNATTMINPAAINASRHLRAELIAWLCKTIALEESKRWKEATFCFHYNKERPLTWWKNGQRVQMVTPCTLSLSHWLEADQTIGVVAAALMRAGRDVVVWTIDGDLLLVCNWVMFHYRFSVAKVNEVMRAYARAPSATLARTFQRSLVEDMEQCGLMATPLKAKFGKEPQLTLILQGNLDNTTGVSMNVFCTKLCNANVTPAHLCALALLTKNDYVIKSTITPNIGAGRMADEMKSRTNPTDTYDAAERVTRMNRVMWMYACPRLNKSLDANAPDANAAKSVKRLIAEHMQIRGVTKVTPENGQTFALAMYRWWRCSVLTENDVLPTPKPDAPPMPAAAAIVVGEDHVDADALREAERMMDNE